MRAASWQQNEPSSRSQRTTDPAADVIGKDEVDPMGVGLDDPRQAPRYRGGNGGGSTLSAGGGESRVASLMDTRFCDWAGMLVPCALKDKFAQTIREAGALQESLWYNPTGAFDIVITPARKPPQLKPAMKLSPKQRAQARKRQQQDIEREKRRRDSKRNRKVKNDEEASGGVSGGAVDRLPGSDQTACLVMADIAQGVANDAAFADNPLEYFDNEFSRLYHGGPIRSIADAERYSPGNLREINQYYASNGSGFQERFRDTSTEPFHSAGAWLNRLTIFLLT